MLYRRKKNIVDPTRINNYNKFLTTLDRTSTIPTIFTTKNYANLLSSINNKTHKDNHSSENTTCLSTDCDFKNAINKIVDQITEDYNVNNYSSPNFTGYNPSDSCCINNSDPNYYRDIIQKSSILNYNRPYISSLKIEIPKTPPPIEIKETIYIDTEIKNISDILKLIETYKIDPSIKYNINMRVLHDIKEPLEELNNMIGINDLKNNIVDQILYFVQELHKGNKTKGDFMHTVIYGPPGTGKTEIAKIMGKLYSKIGVLTEGTFKKVTRSDLIAGYLGQTAIKTSDVIKSAIGGVLFIDEAYALGNPEKRDSFAKECIDTLCEALSDNKDNLMVIIAGYEKELKDCFFVFNQGLESRFTWRFKTDEYNGEDLYHIFMKMVKDIGWECEEKSQITVEWFNKRKDYFKFYGRDIETVLAKTKIAHSRRVFCKCENEKRRISLQDLDKGFEIYLKNEEVKTRKDEIEKKKQLYNTLYC
jgi:SpoVK/Ycf46/Vps4 family AAA+-type ATPase